MMEQRIASIKVPSEAKYIREISSKITGSLTPYKVSENKLFEIKLCVEEALRNAMVHGNKSDIKRSVKVSYWVENNSVNIEIEDEGKGFDHTLVPDPTKDENLTRTDGRGAYLIKKLMDKVEFNKTGNSVRMMKRFD